jgi:cholera toxin transcriptional activator
MSIETPRSVLLRFGVFEADLFAGELRKQGLRIKLQEQPFQVLKALLARPGEIVWESPTWLL